MKLLSISENINFCLIGIEKENETKKINNILKEEKNEIITISGINDKNSSLKNSDKNNNKNINDLIINNYLNTINVGYNTLNNNNNINEINNEEEEDETVNNNNKNIELEPIPSFIYCLKKMNNNNL